MYYLILLGHCTGQGGRKELLDLRRQAVTEIGSGQGWGSLAKPGRRVRKWPVGRNVQCCTVQYCKYGKLWLMGRRGMEYATVEWAKCYQRTTLPAWRRGALVRILLADCSVVTLLAGTSQLENGHAWLGGPVGRSQPPGAEWRYKLTVSRWCTGRSLRRRNWSPGGWNVTALLSTRT